MIFYNLSGGMESAAMLVIDRERIRDTEACVRFADTGKHFPEMAASLAQIGSILEINIVTVPRRITFDEFLFEKGGMIRKGTTDCSRRMKRGNLMRHLKSFPKPCKWNNAVGENGGFEDAHEVNLGFNAKEHQRAKDFVSRNERDWCHWRFPLLENDIERAETVDICRNAGFSILVGMYEKMGRFDCYFCGNQTPKQAMKVVEHYPELAKEWIAAEDRKGHSFMPVPLKVLISDNDIQKQMSLFACSCFGGDDDVWDDRDDGVPSM
jgi:hypothetical protein